MVVRRLRRAALLAAAAGLLAATAVPAARAQLLRLDVADASAVIEMFPLARGERVRAAVELRVMPGYHVNANPPTEEWLIPTVVRLADTPGISLGEVFYPEGADREFDFWSGALSVYEGSVVAGMTLVIADDAPLGTHALIFEIEYQACNNEACFPPNTETATVMVETAAAGAAMRALASPLLERAAFEKPRS